MKLFFTYSANSDFPSRMIQTITKSKWTHCGIILDQELLGDPLVFDSAAEAGGVRIHLWSKHSHMPHAIFEITGAQCSTERQLDLVRDMLSIRYAYFKILLYPIKKYFGEKASSRVISFLNKIGLLGDVWADGMWCSELLYNFLKNAISLETDLDPETITPEDLYQIALKSPQFKKVDA